MDVARSYGDRAPYAPALYEFLLTQLPARRRLLDLGCGPGKVALALVHAFDAVDAVEPAAPMLVVAREQGGSQSINWIEAGTEEAPLFPPYDLVTAGASLHWMKHDVVFPRLADALAPHGILAVIDGDDVFESAWDGELKAFLTRWLARLGRTYDPAGFRIALRGYLPWLDLQGERSFIYEHVTPLRNYVSAQHSRATWTRAAMGETLASEFDEDLAATLTPFANDGLLRFRVKSELVWGRPRKTPKSRAE